MDIMKLVFLLKVDDTGTYTCIASAETPQYIEKRKDVDIVVKGMFFAQCY
jgi:DNA/RNA endonuclease YhcR with UshA esterase domain